MAYGRMDVAVPLAATNKREFSEKWGAFAKIVDPTVDIEALRGCGQQVRRSERHNCAKRGVRIFVRPVSCGNRTWCPHDARRYVMDEVDDSLELVNQLRRTVGRGTKLWFTSWEFTQGDRHGDLVPNDGLGEYRSLGIQRLEVAFPGIMVGGVASVHFWSSSLPLSKWRPHIHGVLLSWVYDNSLSVVGEDDEKSVGGFTERARYLRPDVLESMKVEWKKDLEKKYGLVPQQVQFRKYNVRWNKPSWLSGKMRHRLEYAYRRPIADLHPIVAEGRLGALDEESIALARRLILRPREQRVAWFGWMQPRVRDKYVAFGMKVKKCRDCGHDPHFVRCENVREVEETVIVRRGRYDYVKNVYVQQKVETVARKYRCPCAKTRMFPKKADRERMRRRKVCPDCGEAVEWRHDTDNLMSWDAAAAQGYERIVSDDEAWMDDTERWSIPVPTATGR
jgi:hypothetical protein